MRASGVSCGKSASGRAFRCANLVVSAPLNAMTFFRSCKLAIIDAAFERVHRAATVAQVARAEPASLSPSLSAII